MVTCDFFSEFTRDIYWDCNGDLLGYDLGYDLGYGGRYNQLSNLGLKMAQKLPFHREMMKKKISGSRVNPSGKPWLGTYLGHSKYPTK